jgi:hypothetical protein
VNKNYVRAEVVHNRNCDHSPLIRNICRGVARTEIIGGHTQDHGT